MIKIGCHLSSSGGFEKMGKTACSIGANTFQFFLRNPRGGSAKAIHPEDAERLRVLLEENEFAPILAHAPYTLNMASERPETREFAKMTFADDLNRMEMIPCQYYNFHPGSHTGAGVEIGIQRIVEILNEVVTEDISSVILLETMAGKGSEIGRSFDEIALILNQVKYPEKYGVCLDTCHLYCAGYDIVENLEGVIEELDVKIGLDLVKMIHLNDSLQPLGSNKDRHAGIGEGQIGLEGLIRFIRHPAFCEVPFILETPYDEAGHAREIQLIRKMTM